LATSLTDCSSIFTGSAYAIAIAKADRIKETIEALGGTVLEYVDTPIADTSSRMPAHDHREHQL